MKNPRYFSAGAAVAIYLLVGFLFVERAEAVYFGDTQELHRRCESETAYDQTHCYGYLFGVISAQYHDATGQYCLPAGIKGSTLRKIVVKYGNDNPRDLALRKNPAIFVMDALWDAFPCN